MTHVYVMVSVYEPKGHDYGDVSEVGCEFYVTGSARFKI
jgi:hypothetical protein